MTTRGKQRQKRPAAEGVRANEPWIDTDELFYTLNDARIAAHDYAHCGWKTRVKRLPEEKGRRQMWELWVQWGRLNFPRCCTLRPRWRVPDDEEEILWKPIEDRGLRRQRLSAA